MRGDKCIWKSIFFSPLFANPCSPQAGTARFSVAHGHLRRIYCTITGNWTFFCRTPSHKWLCCSYTTTGHTVAYRRKTTVGFPNITQDVIYEQVASHPAFLSLLYHITLKKTHPHTKSQRMNQVVSCGVSVFFFNATVLHLLSRLFFFSFTVCFT